MISTKMQAAIRPTSLLLRMVWAGEFFCYGVYYFIVRQATLSPGTPIVRDERLPLIFGVLSGVSLLAGLAMNGFLFSRRRAQIFLGPFPPPSAGMTGDGTPEEQTLIMLAKKTGPLYMISLGFINSSILFGMVLSLNRHELGAFTPFAIGAVAGTLLCFPRLDAFIEDSLQTWGYSPK